MRPSKARRALGEFPTGCPAQAVIRNPLAFNSPDRSQPRAVPVVVTGRAMTTADAARKS